MIECRDVADRWSAYLDGEVDDVTASALRGHLRTCAACRGLVEDGARMREAMSELPPAEVPGSLWNAIEARLGEAEIGDARRSRASRWLERARVALRRHALPSAVGAAAVATVVLAVVRTTGDGGGGGGGGTRPAIAEVGSSGTPDSGAATPVTPTGPEIQASDALPKIDFAAERLAEVERADRRYRDTIAELEELAAEERPAWPEAVRGMFDRRLGALRSAVSRELSALTGTLPDPANRDGLYAAYREEIAFLQKAALGELTVARAGVP